MNSTFCLCFLQEFLVSGKLFKDNNAYDIPAGTVQLEEYTADWGDISQGETDNDNNTDQQFILRSINMTVMPARPFSRFVHIHLIYLSYMMGV